MRYVIHDNEGGNFCDWSHDKPPTETEIIEYFKTMSDFEDLGGDEPIPLETFSLEFIQDLWNVEIIPVKDHIQALEAELKETKKFSNAYRSIIDELNIMKGAIYE